MADFVVYAAYALGAVAFVKALSVNQNFAMEQGRIDDLTIKGSRYGEGIPFAMGVTRVPLNMVWADLMQEHITKESAGGKGGGGGANISTYSYTASFGGVLSYNKQSHPLKIFFDKELVWQQPSGGTAVTGNFTDGGSFEFLGGGDTQVPPAIVESIMGADNSPAYRGRGSIWFTDVNCARGTRPTIEVEMVAANGHAETSMPELIQLISDEAGIPAGFVDTSELSLEFAGARIEPGTAGSAIEMLLNSFGIYGVSSGDSYSFRPFEQTVPDWIIPEDELLVGSGGATAAFPIKMARDEDLPNSVYVKYIDLDRDHQENTQRAFRKTGRSTQKVTITVKIVMRAAQAAQLAESILYRAWVAQRQYGPFTLPRKYFRLEPGDIIKVQHRGRIHTVRLKTITYGADMSLRCAGEAYDPTVIQVVESGTAGEGFPTQELPYFGTTYSMLLNLPALTASEVDKTGFYFAAAGTGRAWRGGTLEVSRAADGSGWVEVGAVPGASLMGECLTVLPPPPVATGHIMWDLTSTLDVSMINGTISSVTSDELFAGANAFVVGNEVLQARNSVALGGGVFRLSNFLRGRRGTDEATAGHAAGEMLIGTGNLRFFEFPAADRGNTLNFRLRLYNTTEIVEFSALYTGVSAQPWKPTPIRGVWAGAGGDLTISIMPVTRRFQEFPNNGETPPEYLPLVLRINLYDASWVLIRSIDLTDAYEFVYTASAQIADYGSAQAELRIGVQQYSPNFGFGVENRVFLES